MDPSPGLPSPALDPQLQLPSDNHSSPSPVGCKRKRSSSSASCIPPTPPDTPPDNTVSTSRMLDRAVHILATESAALRNITQLYQTDVTARTGLIRAVETIVRSHDAGGKLIICGIGKSGFVGMKMCAMLKSLGVGSSFLHPSEALHGDLGDIRTNDTLLFLTFSGKTAEILNVIPHVKSDIPVIALTSHTSAATCPIVNLRPEAILLPAPIHQPEEESFGVSAPTTSTTVAMAVGDMLALSVVERIHQSPKVIFNANHPGGALGEKAREELKGLG